MLRCKLQELCIEKQFNFIAQFLCEPCLLNIHFSDILGSGSVPSADESNEAERAHGKMRSRAGLTGGRELDPRLGQIGI